MIVVIFHNFPSFLTMSICMFFGGFLLNEQKLFKIHKNPKGTFMEIYKKHQNTVTPTCVKESLERKKKLAKAKQEQPPAVVVPSPSVAPTTPVVPIVPTAPTDTLPTVPVAPVNPIPTENNANMPVPNLDNLLEPTSFPEIVNAFPTTETIRTLKFLNFGRDGELSILLSYIYQLSVLSSQNVEFRLALESFVATQLEVYRALSNAVVAFGGSPTLTDGRGNVWTGRNIVSTNNPRCMLQRNIENLETSIKNFNRALGETTNQSLQNLYIRIIEEKEKQLSALQNLLVLT